MGTEKYWQQERKRVEMNKDNIHPDIKQTMEDNKAIQPLKNPKSLYYQCLQGALYWKQWAQSDGLTIDEAATIICRDTGCELTYCQATLYDPYERPFENCDFQYKQLTKCIAQEEKRYEEQPQGNTLQEHTMIMLERKRKEKYFDLTEKLKEQTVDVNGDREYFIKDSKMSMNNKI